MTATAITLTQLPLERSGFPATTGKTRMLVMLGCYWPGNDASGPNESIRNLCEALKGDVAVDILAHGGPPGGDEGTLDSWVDRGFARFRYLSRDTLGIGERAAVLNQTQYDLLALNGLFDPVFTLSALVLRKIGLIPVRPTLLWPRGELSPGALALKATKKKAYLTALKASRLLEDVWLVAASELEVDHIRAALPNHERVMVAPNIRQSARRRPIANRAAGPLRLVYLSRIDAKKNLLLALQVVHAAGVPVQFDIYGPVSDEAYWRRCLSEIARLPSTIVATWKGVAPREQVPGILSGYDALFLPTAGENFGHALFDALEVGTPILTSTLTPLRNLAATGAGWDIDLSDFDRFVVALRNLGAASEAQRRTMREAAQAYATRYTLAANAVGRTRDLLSHVMNAAE